MPIHSSKEKTTSSPAELIACSVGFFSHRDTEQEDLHDAEKTCEMINRLVGILVAMIEVKKHLFHILF